MPRKRQHDVIDSKEWQETIKTSVKLLRKAAKKAFKKNKKGVKK